MEEKDEEEMAKETAQIKWCNKYTISKRSGW